MKSWIDARVGDAHRGREVSLVFVRGLSAGAFAEGLGGLRREVLETGSGGGWFWAVHEMCAPETGDFETADYRPLYGDGDGVEVVVFVVEPCSARAHPPNFTYLRGGRCVLHFSFEDLAERVGDNPDHLSPELLEAGLIGPGTVCDVDDDEDGHDCDEHERDDDVLVRTIAAFFGLPSPPLAASVAAGTSTGVPG
ncbi:hypothetical protein [Streptomyces sp. NPDC003327]